MRSSEFAPVIKSNAYGHGLKEIYTILQEKKLRWLCVNYLYEARLLREAGYQGRLLVVGPACPDSWPQAHEIKAEVVVGNVDILKSWLDQPLRVAIHVKFDTGMGRQGFLPSEAQNVLFAISEAQRTELVQGVLTHFANVEDVTDQSYALRQLQRFHQAADIFRQAGLKPIFHCASSASTLIMDQSHLDLVRVGISLYGLWPSSLTRVSYLQLHQNLPKLEPVLSWYTKIAAIKSVAKGEFIGYGCTYRAIRPMRIGVLPIGYFEGYPRLAGESPAYVLIRGQRCPVVGRICMNMMMVDISHLEDTDGGEVQIGNPVTLIGRDGSETLSAHDLASWSKTIHYEVLSRLSGELPRVIVD